jgi:hypothetical protein
MIATREKEKGFAALITAIVLSLILIVATVTLNRSSFFTRSAIIDSELKATSSALAEACVDTAILRLAINPSYNLSTPDPVSVGTLTCEITSVENNTPAGFHTIKTGGERRESVTKLEVRLDASDLSVDFWKEIL